SRRRLALLPLPPVDREHLPPLVVLDPPEADDGHQQFRLGTDGFVGEIDCQLRSEGRKDDREKTRRDRNHCSKTLASGHGGPPSKNEAEIPAGRGVRDQPSTMSTGSPPRNQSQVASALATRG